ncbi:MAG: sigma-70 family RNA polymerase sigma factor [Planctomycetaceae bacterium]|nr:sigma-70 family RNA polymerase sigma factor [Planctomycetaceae bacterium]
MSRSTENNTSLTLLNLVRRNDPRAWETFVKLYAPLVYSWCRAAGLQPADVADVAQEVFHTLHGKLDTFEPGRRQTGAFRAWLWGITRLKLLEHHRAARRQPVGKGGSAADIRIEQLQTDVDEADTSLSLNSKQILVTSALQMLKSEFEPQTWQAFWLMSVEGLQAREVGERLNMTAQAVRQAKYRVARRTREFLNAELGNERVALSST